MSETIVFDVLQARLIQQVRLRINNGEFTERGLARLLGISQSQIHNVLKGARRLQMHLADRILMKLGLSAMDLLHEGELDAALRQRIANWDREVAALAGDDLADAEVALDELVAIKRPTARCETGLVAVRKTG